jgi:hypothetical protein
VEVKPATEKQQEATKISENKTENPIGQLEDLFKGSPTVGLSSSSLLTQQPSNVLSSFGTPQPANVKNEIMSLFEKVFYYLLLFGNRTEILCICKILRHVFFGRSFATSNNLRHATSMIFFPSTNRILS